MALTYKQLRSLLDNPKDLSIYQIELIVNALKKDIVLLEQIKSFSKNEYISFIKEIAARRNYQNALFDVHHIDFVKNRENTSKWLRLLPTSKGKGVYQPAYLRSRYYNQLLEFFKNHPRSSELKLYIEFIIEKYQAGATGAQTLIYALQYASDNTVSQIVRNDRMNAIASGLLEGMDAYKDDPLPFWGDNIPYSCMPGLDQRLLDYLAALMPQDDNEGIIPLKMLSLEDLHELKKIPQSSYRSQEKLYLTIQNLSLESSKTQELTRKEVHFLKSLLQGSPKIESKILTYSIEPEEVYAQTVMTTFFVRNDGVFSFSDEIYACYLKAKMELIGEKAPEFVQEAIIVGWNYDHQNVDDLINKSIAIRKNKLETMFEKLKKYEQDDLISAAAKLEKMKILNQLQDYLVLDQGVPVKPYTLSDAGKIYQNLKTSLMKELQLQIGKRPADLIQRSDMEILIPLIASENKLFLKGDFSQKLQEDSSTSSDILTKMSQISGLTLDHLISLGEVMPATKSENGGAILLDVLQSKLEADHGLSQDVEKLIQKISNKKTELLNLAKLAVSSKKYLNHLVLDSELVDMLSDHIARSDPVDRLLCQDELLNTMIQDGSIQLNNLMIEKLFKLACCEGFVKSVKTLFSMGINPNSIVNEEGDSPLLCATKQHSIELVNEILDHPLVDRFTQTPDGENAIHLAVQSSSLEMTQKLMEKQIDPNHKNNEGYSPLFYAVQLGHIGLVKTLLSSERISIHSSAEADPFLLAVKKGRKDIVELFLNHHELNINAVTSQNNNALVLAIHNSHTEIAQMLIKRDDLKLDTLNSTGNTALIEAAQHGNDQIVKALLDKGQDPNLQNKHGNTALIWAAYCGHTEVTNQLLEAKSINLGIRNNKGMNAFMIASDKKKLGVKTYLDKKMNLIDKENIRKLQSYLNRQTEIGFTDEQWHDLLASGIRHHQFRLINKALQDGAPCDWNIFSKFGCKGIWIWSIEKLRRIVCSVYTKQAEKNIYHVKHIDDIPSAANETQHANLVFSNELPEVLQHELENILDPSLGSYLSSLSVPNVSQVFKTP